MLRELSVFPSQMSTRTRALLATALGAPLLLCCAATASAKRPNPPVPATEVVEVELSEIGGENHSLTFLVPIEGQVAAPISLFDKPGHCKLVSTPRRDELVQLELHCSRPDLELEATRALTVGVPTILTEVELPEDRRLQVIATRR